MHWESLVDECQHIVGSIHTEQWFTRGTIKYGHPLYVPYEEKWSGFRYSIISGTLNDKNGANDANNGAYIEGEVVYG